MTKDVPDGVVVAGVPARVSCDIDDYRRRVVDKAIHVGNLSPTAKRTVLAQRFG